MKQEKQIIPAHPNEKTELERRMERSDFDLAYKEFREDTHPAFYGGFGTVNKDDHLG